MELTVGFATSDRRFARATFRLGSRIEEIERAFEKVPIANAGCDGIIVGVTDDKQPGYFEVIPNDDSVFQVLVGCRQSPSDEELVRDVYKILERVIRESPLGQVDQDAAVNALEEHQRATARE
jgi:hypothetical protein